MRINQQDLAMYVSAFQDTITVLIKKTSQQDTE